MRSNTLTRVSNNPGAVHWLAPSGTHFRVPLPSYSKGPRFESWTRYQLTQWVTAIAATRFFFLGLIYLG